MSVPRGIRNNNPGNIRKSPIQWQGEVVASNDPAFECFLTPEHGLRAIARILLNYQRPRVQSPPLHTIAQMIDRWAPPVENDTGAYVHAVASACGISPTEPVELAQNIPVLCDMVTAIVRHENGVQPYTQEMIHRAVLSAIGG